MNKTHDSLTRALGHLFVGDEEDGNAYVVAEAAREDDALRSLFEQLALVDRELHGSEAPCEFEHRFRDQQVLGAIDAMLAEEACTKEEEPALVVDLASRRPSRVAFAGALLAAAAAVALVMGPIVTTGPDDGFQARSGVLVASDGYERPSLQVFCVQDGADGPEFRSADDFPLDLVRCPVDDHLKIAYRNVDPRLKYVSLVGISEHGRMHWYGPSPAAKGAVSADVSDEAISAGETIRLKVNHEAGAVRLHGLFTEDPMNFSDLKRWAEHQRARGFEQNLEAPDRGTTTSMIFEVEATQVMEDAR